MKKWSWMRELRGLLSVGAALVGGAAFAGEGSMIPQVANPDAVFQPTGYSLTSELGCNPQCAAPQCAAPQAAGCGPSAGCNGGDPCDWCNLGEPWTLSKAVYGDCPAPINFGGWTSFGYGRRPDGIFVNEQENGRIQANQIWLYAEKALNAEAGCLDWGFRADALYGTDAQNTQAFGNNRGEFDFFNGYNHGPYGFAIPQLYATLGNADWDLKAGHFFTHHGYEVVGATGNFFYSHAYTFNFSEPFTHTGVMAHKKVSDTLDVSGGWVLGWDTGFDQFSGGSAFMGQVGVQVSEKVKFIYTGCVGDLGWRGDGSNHTFLVDVSITDNLKWVIMSDVVSTNGTWTNAPAPPAVPTFVPGVGNDQYSLANYLIYKINDCVSTGARLEWWKSDGQSINEVTYGVNYKPHANVTFRPEVRYDWNPGTGAILNGRGNNEQTSFNFDVIFTF